MKRKGQDATEQYDPEYNVSVSHAIRGVVSDKDAIISNAFATAFTENLRTEALRRRALRLEAEAALKSRIRAQVALKRYVHYCTHVSLPLRT